MSELKQKLKQKILNKWVLSLKDKLLLEKIDSTSEEELENRLLKKNLKKINLMIDKLDKKEIYWNITEEEKNQLGYLVQKKKQIIDKIRSLRENKELTIEDFNPPSNIDMFNFKWFWEVLGSAWDKFIDFNKEMGKEITLDIGIDSILDWLFS